MSIGIFKTALVFAYTIIIIAAIYVSKRAQRVQKCSFDAFKANKTEIKLLLRIRPLLGLPIYIGFVEWLVPFVWFPWAYLPFPPWVNWLGLFLLFISILFLWWSFLSIGANYHGTIGLHKNHQLITTGSYKYIRHPITISFIPVMISIFLLTSNWLIGVPALVLTITILIVRTPVEETQLLDRFGDEYKQYKKRTGKFFPK